jgi:hypothetical protein
VEAVDRVVVDFLHQAVGPPPHVNSAEDLEKGPDDVLPPLVCVRVPASLLEVDRFQTGPEDHQKNRAPARISIPGVGLEDRAEDLVLARIDRGALPHEGDDVGPGAEAAEEKLRSLQFVEERLVGAATEFLFELFTVISFRAHEALGSEITVKALKVGQAPQRP